MSGADRIAKERQRQIDSEGYTAEHDEGHPTGDLALAACCYAMPKKLYLRYDGGSYRNVNFADPWPWSCEEDKRASQEPHLLSTTEKIRQLEKAGALIAAEIDRLLRADGEEQKGAPDG